MSRPRPLSLAAALVAAAVLASALAAACGPHRSLGERVWRDRCTKCHGLDGSGNTPRYMGTVEADLLDDTWVHGSDSSAIESVIRDGVLGRMPPFDMLTDEEVRAVIDYLRELRGEATG